MIERTARKEHTCVLCFNKIKPGECYAYERLTPWSHAENEGFADFKAHLHCKDIWDELGHECDWELPPDKDAWRQLTDIA